LNPLRQLMSNRTGEKEKMNTFYDYPMGDSDSQAQFSIFGIPWDANSTHNKGCARAAPSKLRDLTTMVGRLTETFQNIYDFKAYDFGDVKIYPSLPDKNRENINLFIKEYLPWKETCSVPIMIGGDHYCTFPVVKAINEIYQEKSLGEIGIIVFDSHLDYYDKWLGVETDFHCTVTKRIADLPNIGPKKCVVIGARDIDNDEYEIAQNDDLYFVPAHKITGSNRTIGFLKEIEKVVSYFKDQNISKVYVSIDIDVLDGCIAPGTGYTIPGGIDYRQLWESLEILSKELDIIGFDLVEVAPDMDLPSNLTQITAIKLIVEFMGFIQQKLKN
jgi:agmatinase